MWWYLWYLLQSSFDGAPCAPGWFCEIAADVARQGRPSGGNIVAVVLRLQQLVTTAHLFDILFFIFFETALPFLRGFTHPCSSDRSWPIRLFVCASKPRYPTQRNAAGRIGNKLAASNEQTGFALGPTKDMSDSIFAFYALTWRNAPRL